MTTGADSPTPRPARTALLLAPNGGRLDGPAAAALARAARAALAQAGRTAGDPAALIALLSAAPAAQEPPESLSLAEYALFLSGLDETRRRALADARGAPESDPAYRPGALDCGRLLVPARVEGSWAVCRPPAPGHAETAPAHGRLAFEVWLRSVFRAEILLRAAPLAPGGGAAPALSWAAGILDPQPCLDLEP